MKIDLPYLFAPKGKGRRYYYYRRAGERQPIATIDGRRLDPVIDGMDAFVDAWSRIHRSFEDRPNAAPSAGTLRNLVGDYLESADYLQLAPSSRKDYRRICDDLVRRFGDLPVATLPREFVIRLRDSMKATPRQANYTIAVLRVLLSFAMDRPATYRLSVNPANDVRKLRTGPGHEPWTDSQIASYRDRWPAGSWERTAFELLLNTGQRGGDVAGMKRTQYAGGWIRVRQAKGGDLVEIPASAALQDALQIWLSARPAIDMLPGERGGSIKVDAFRHRMKDAYRAAGLDAVTTHGLRYTAATILDELGCDERTIAAITGHRTGQMVRKYTAKKRRAAAAIARLDANTENKNSVV